MIIFLDSTFILFKEIECQGMEVIEGQFIKYIDQFDGKQHMCIKCGKRLIKFIAYIPAIGEACMDCYIKYAQDMEKQGT